MTSTGRLKRSCLCAVVGVIASAVGVLTLGFIANKSNAANFGGGDLLTELVGVFLAPGWLMFHGMFERASPSQFPGLAAKVLLVSLVVDTGLVFVVWELFYKSTKHKQLSS